MNLAELVQSTGWKAFMSKLYGWGASIVIIGALFKIQHWHLAGLMLSIGLITEAIIFFFSAFEPLHDEIDWTLVYPELEGIPEGDTIGIESHDGRHHGGGGGGAGSVALAKFDEMLEKAEITPDLFQKLGVGMKKLSETTANMNVMGDVTAASSYSKKSYVSGVSLLLINI